MSGWLLIDGYNLLHASEVFGEGGRTSLESSREALLAWLAERLSQRARRKTTIVFDARFAPPGLPRTVRRAEMQVEFAPRGQEADAVLEQLIETHRSPREVTVVSSDHRLHRAARRRKCRAVDSDTWVLALRQEAGKQPPEEEEAKPSGDEPLDKEELRQWLDEFGLE